MGYTSQKAVYIGEAYHPFTLAIRMASSTLNPNAPMFVPSEYREVEDFSEQWWDLVHSSPWFRHYWLHECFSDPQTDLNFNTDFIIKRKYLLLLIIFY